MNTFFRVHAHLDNHDILFVVICGHGSWSKTVKQNPYKYRDQAYSSIDFADKALQGHVFNTTEVTNLNNCIHKCMERKHECHSFNIGRSNSTNLYICELNKASREYYPLNIVDRVDFYYYDVYWAK